MRGFLIKLRIARAHTARRQVSLYPNNRLNLVSDSRVIKIDHAKHRAVIGQRHSGHLHLFGALDQLLDIAEAIQERIFRVNVEMDEGHSKFIIARKFESKLKTKILQT